MEEQTFKFLNKSFTLVAILVAGVLVFFVGQMAYNFRALDNQNINQITVSGEGKVYAKPDVAMVSLGVTTTGQTTADVISESSEKMNAVIKAVKDSGVEDKDIQTTNYNLYPLYNYTEAAGRVFQGYTLEQSVSVKIRDFAKVGEILQKATGAGANMTGNLVFTIDDPEQYKAEARAKAIEQAKEKAQSLASASGIRLGKLVNVYENYYYPMYESSKAYGLGGGSVDAVMPAPSIESGQQEITININLTYQVR